MTSVTVHEDELARIHRELEQTATLHELEPVRLELVLSTGARQRRLIRSRAAADRLRAETYRYAYVLGDSSELLEYVVHEVLGPRIVSGGEMLVTSFWRAP